MVLSEHHPSTFVRIFKSLSQSYQSISSKALPAYPFTMKLPTSLLAALLALHIPLTLTAPVAVPDGCTSTSINGQTTTTGNCNANQNAQASSSDGGGSTGGTSGDGDTGAGDTGAGDSSGSSSLPAGGSLNIAPASGGVDVGGAAKSGEDLFNSIANEASGGKFPTISGPFGK